MSNTDKPVSGLITTTPRKDWTDYKLETHNVFVNGKETNTQAIVYNSKFVNFLSKWYHVLPNEEVIQTADLIADQLKFKKFVTTKYHKEGWFKQNGHVISNPDKTQISATYLFKESVDVTGRGDKVELGFTVRNSIDGKGGAFSVSPFTHRLACDNLAFHLAYDKALHTGLETNLVGSGYHANLIKLEESEVLKKQLEDIQKARESFKSKIWKSHFKGLNIGYVTNAILTVQEQAQNVYEQYRKAVELKIAQAQLESLKARLPVSVHKYASDEVKDSVLTYDAKKKELVARKDATIWQVFNNYTEALTYAQKRNYTTTLENYKEVDRILINPIQVRA